MTTVLFVPLVQQIVIEISPLNFLGLRIEVDDRARARALLNGLENIGGISEGNKKFKVIDLGQCNAAISYKISF